MTGTVAGSDVDVYSFQVASTGQQVVAIVDDDPDNDGIFTDTQLTILDPDGTTVLATGDDQPGNKANAAGAFVTTRRAGFARKECTAPRAVNVTVCP